MCLYFFFHANNTPIRACILLIKPLQQEFFGMFLFSPKKTMYDLKFSQEFLGNQSFSTKAEIKVFVLTNKF
jgi:hypothetical protein